MAAEQRPTMDPQSGQEPVTGGSGSAPDEAKAQEIVQTLVGYKEEAKQARSGGDNPRDAKWKENLDLYWNRHDFSRKAAWQAREALPEVPTFVDRFAAALKEALMSTNGGFYAVVDPKDKEGDLGNAIKKMLDLWLDTSGANYNGNILGFPAVFEEQIKLGALMAVSSVTTWKTDVKGGRVAIDAVDPRRVWLDHTGRNLYRIRQIELDRHELKEMVAAKDSKGTAIFNTGELDRLVTSLSTEEAAQKRSLSGTGQEITTTRSPIVLDEYIATVVGREGEKTHDRALFTVANDRFLVRGPEKNPFWHGKDWLTFAPLVTVPLSPYGRSYMEDFGSLARTFNSLTNMILDAVHVSALKMWAIVPGMLVNPAQLGEGAVPMKLWQLEEGVRAQDFAAALEMGTLPAEAVRVWQMLKQELSEAANINEIGMGQFAPKGRTSAAEVLSTQQSSSAMIRNVAETVETRWLDPTLDLGWKTGLQHVQEDNEAFRIAVGEQMFQAIFLRRREIITRPITFRARGLSEMIQRTQALKALLGILQIISGNPILLQEFFKTVSITRFIEILFNLSNFDLTKLQASEREQMIKQIAQPIQQAVEGAGGEPAAPGKQEMGSVSKLVGGL